MRFVATFLTVLTFLSADAFASTGDLEKFTTIILVRHAEKTSTDDDAPLSDAGRARATELARVLRSANIDTIYSTQWIRTKDTARPLATALAIEPIIVPSGKSYAADMAERIRKLKAGSTALVVGHSNSTINVLKELGFTSVPAMADSDYDDLFIVTLGPGSPKLVTLSYGKATE